MPLINCEINLILIWANNGFTSYGTRAAECKIINTKLYVPVVTLSSQYNAKLRRKLKFSFKRAINWNKYQSKISVQAPNHIQTT